MLCIGLFVCPFSWMAYVWSAILVIKWQWKFPCTSVLNIIFLFRIVKQKIVREHTLKKLLTFGIAQIRGTLPPPNFGHFPPKCIVIRGGGHNIDMIKFHLAKQLTPFSWLLGFQKYQKLFSRMMGSAFSGVSISSWVWKYTCIELLKK